MSNDNDFELEQLESRLQEALHFIWDIAYESKNETFKLLEILRRLESLHQQIRDSFFQESLPNNRQALYALLKDIEAKGGWPYIYRLKLQELMERMSRDEIEEIFPQASQQSFNSRHE